MWNSAHLWPNHSLSPHSFSTTPRAAKPHLQDVKITEYFFSLARGQSLGNEQIFLCMKTVSNCTSIEELIEQLLLYIEIKRCSMECNVTLSLFHSKRMYNFHIDCISLEFNSLYLYCIYYIMCIIETTDVIYNLIFMCMLPKCIRYLIFLLDNFNKLCFFFVTGKRLSLT